MHVGYGAAFQNPNNAHSDAEVYRNELRLAEMAEPLGFDSVWGGRASFRRLHDVPRRAAVPVVHGGPDQAREARLDGRRAAVARSDSGRRAGLDARSLSNGRFILGLGRGLARIEYEGFRLDQNEGRNLFVEYAELVLNALEKGYMEGGRHTNQPRRDIRPFPARSFQAAAPMPPRYRPSRCRSWRSSGVGVLVIPQKPWDAVKKDFEVYHKVWREVNGREPPPSRFRAGSSSSMRTRSRAQELGMKYITDYYHTAMKHYEMTSEKFGQNKSYEFYSGVSKYHRAPRHG